MAAKKNLHCQTLDLHSIPVFCYTRPEIEFDRVESPTAVNRIPKIIIIYEEMETAIKLNGTDCNLTRGNH